MILGEDTSHFQGTPNWSQSVAAGRPFCVLKATEGTTFIDPTLTTNRNNAHAAGKIVGLYHFARAGNAAAEAAFFVKTIGPLRPGEFLVLDQEVANTVAWCKQWLDAVYAATGVRPLIYMNQSATTGLKLGNWSSVAKDYGLWLAVYDNSTAQPSVPYWGAPAMKQFYDKGSVPGISGPCDVDVFYGTTQQLLAYGKGGAPAPSATVQEDKMRLIRTPDGAIWSVTETEVAQIADLGTAQALAAVWGVPIDSMDFPTKDAVYMDADAREKRYLKAAQAYLLGADPGTDDSKWLLPQVWAIASALGKLQTGGVDPKTVVAGVLDGLDGAKLSVQPAPAKP